MILTEELIQTKAETYTVESYNGQIRHFLARFRSKSKYYSKSVEMMTYSLKLLMAKKQYVIYTNSLTTKKSYYHILEMINTYKINYSTSDSKDKFQ